MGGPSRSEGRLEIYYHGQWSAVCDDDWFSETNTVVVCNQLGYRGGRHPSSYYGDSDVSYWIDDVICIGTEERLSDCRFSERDYETCSDRANGQVGVRCDTDTGQSGMEGEIRLLGGPTDLEGRLEIYHDGQWGVVCDNNWNYTTGGEVVCRQLGFGGVIWPDSDTWYGTSYSKYWIADVVCDGTEKSLTDCKYSESYSQPCSIRSNWQVSIKCTKKEMTTTTMSTPTSPEPSKALLPLENVRLLRLPIDTVTLTWDIPSDDMLAVHVYYTTVTDTSMEKWQQEQLSGNVRTAMITGLLPSYSYAFRVQAIYHQGGSELSDVLEVSNIRNIRLTNGATPNEGLIEAFHDSTWGHVCDSHWDVRDAVVVCRQIGLSGGEPLIGSYFGKGLSHKVLVNVSCTGKEEEFEKCPFAVVDMTTCGNSESAGVRCNPFVPEISSKDETDKEMICNLADVKRCSEIVAHINDVVTGNTKADVHSCEHTYPTFASCLHDLSPGCKSTDNFGPLKAMHQRFRKKCLEI